MRKVNLTVLFVLMPFIAFSQKVIYSSTIKLNIPAKIVEDDSIKIDQTEVKNIENTTIEFVNIIDSLIISDKNIATEVTVDIDTIFENDKKVQILKFSFQPTWKTIKNISDYPSGIYELKSSSISMYLSNIVKEALQRKILFYADSTDNILLRIKGAADATQIKGIKYKNEFGDKIEQKYFHEGKKNVISVEKGRLITKNKELAFLRTYGIRTFLEANIAELQNFNVNFEHYVEVFKEVGGTYRRVAIEVIIKHQL